MKWALRAADEYRIKTIHLPVLKNFEEYGSDEREPLLSAVIALYKESAPKYIEKIRLATIALDYTEIYLCAQMLKSSSANIGALVLSGICEKLEFMTDPEMQSASPQNTLKGFQDLEAEFVKVISELSIIHQLVNGELDPENFRRTG